MQYIEKNLIKNKFEIIKPNYLWCSDITELIAFNNYQALVWLYSKNNKRLSKGTPFDNRVFYEQYMWQSQILILSTYGLLLLWNKNSKLTEE